MATESECLDNREQMVFKLKYAKEYGLRITRLLGRFQLMFRIVTLFAATAAIAVWSAQILPTYVAVGGAIVALLAIAEVVIDPGRLAALCREQVRKISELEAASETMSESDLRSAWARLANSEIPQWELLRKPVFNEIVTRLELSHAVVPVTRIQRLAFALS